MQCSRRRVVQTQYAALAALTGLAVIVASGGVTKPKAVVHASTRTGTADCTYLTGGGENRLLREQACIQGPA